MNQIKTEKNQENKKVVYRVVSDNFNGLLSPVAYKQLCLSMSSGDFGSHSKTILKLKNYEIKEIESRDKLTYVEMFNEEWDATTLAEEYADIVDKLTFKQYSKLMGGSMEYLDKLVQIKKVTKNKQILNKVDSLINIYRICGYLEVLKNESVGA